MKIVKPGKHMNRQWTAEFTCTGEGNGNSGCGALLEIAESDLYQTYNSCMGRSQTWFSTFLCPCCGQETDIANTDGYKHPDANGAPSPRDLENPGRAAIKAAKERLKEGGTYVSPLKLAKGVQPTVKSAPLTDPNHKVTTGMEAEHAFDGGSLENRVRRALDG